MRWLRAWRALPGRDRALLVEAFATLAAVRLALHLLTLERLRAWTGRLGDGDRPLERIVWAVRTASREMPGATCLCAALALQRMLARRGYLSELHIGVARNDQGLAAHAWIVHDRCVLIGEQEQETYTPLAAWPAGEPQDRARGLPSG